MYEKLRNFIYGVCSLIGGAIVVALILVTVFFGGTIISILGLIAGIVCLTVVVAMFIYQTLTERDP